jgi:hypothetical protein
MSVPPNIMQAMMNRAPTAGPPGMGAGAPPPSPVQGGIGATSGQPPAAAPLSGPQPKKGLQAAAMTNVHIAVNMLEEALSGFGSESEQGGDILKAISILRKHVAKRDSSDLVPAEILQLARRLPQLGGGTSAQQAIMAQMRKPAPLPGQGPGAGGAQLPTPQAA